MCRLSIVCDFLQDDKWSKDLDPKLQSLLSELETGLATVMRRKENKSGQGRGDAEESLGGELMYGWGGGLFWIMDYIWVAVVQKIIVVCTVTEAMDSCRLMKLVCDSI